VVGRRGGALDSPTSDREAPLCEVFEVAGLGAEGWKLSCIIFPEKLPLVETPLRGSSTLDVGVVGVRHIGQVLMLETIERRGRENNISIDISADN
jgi:hypothetical protein